MRVLITGIAGFVGSHLVRHCLHAGDEVWGFARPGDLPSALGPVLSSIRLVRGDLLKEEDVFALVRDCRPEGCIHLAAQSSVIVSMADPVLTWEVNVRGTLRLYEALRREAPLARIAFVGSGEIYGAVPAERQPIRETEEVKPANPYAASKAAADLLSWQYFQNFQLPIVRLRPFNHTGPGQPPGFIAPDIACQIAQIEKGLAPPRISVGDLDPEKDFADVRDIARAYRLSLTAGEPGQAYNIGSGRAVSIRRIVETLISFARRPIEVRPESTRLRPGQPLRQIADIGAFTRATGWKPEIPIETTLLDVMEDWRGRT